MKHRHILNRQTSYLFLTYQALALAGGTTLDSTDALSITFLLPQFGPLKDLTPLQFGHRPILPLIPLNNNASIMSTLGMPDDNWIAAIEDVSLCLWPYGQQAATEGVPCRPHNHNRFFRGGFWKENIGNFIDEQITKHSVRGSGIADAPHDPIVLLEPAYLSLYGSPGGDGDACSDAAHTVDDARIHVSRWLERIEQLLRGRVTDKKDDTNGSVSARIVLLGSSIPCFVEGTNEAAFPISQTPWGRDPIFSATEAVVLSLAFSESANADLVWTPAFTKLPNQDWDVLSLLLGDKQVSLHAPLVPSQYGSRTVGHDGGDSKRKSVRIDANADTAAPPNPFASINPATAVKSAAPIQTSDGNRPASARDWGLVYLAHAFLGLLRDGAPNHTDVDHTQNDTVYAALPPSTRCEIGPGGSASAHALVAMRADLEHTVYNEGAAALWVRQHVFRRVIANNTLPAAIAAQTHMRYTPLRKGHEIFQGMMERKRRLDLETAGKAAMAAADAILAEEPSDPEMAASLSEHSIPDDTDFSKAASKEPEGLEALLNLAACTVGVPT
jgi:hypothetical protein